MKSLKAPLTLIALTITLIAIIFIGWVLYLNNKIAHTAEGDWFLPPTEIYSAPIIISKSSSIPIEKLIKTLLDKGFRRREPHQAILIKDFSQLSGENCRLKLTSDEELADWNSESQCLLFSEHQDYFKLIVYNNPNQVESVYEGAILKEMPQIQLPAELFAQFYDGQPIMRELTPLHKYPIACLNAVQAIEDKNFLQHNGVSPTAIVRAIFDFVRTAGRFKSGASTITQQLVKNYFLTSDRTFSRKFTEMIMALLLEIKISKDKILEAYLNVIYMGQRGPFQIRGFGSAAKTFFNKPIEQLELSECALLAGLLNSPGRFNPFAHPENSLKRRDKVIQDMAKYDFIDETSLHQALAQELPKKTNHTYTDPAPYFINSALKSVEQLRLAETKGLKVYTTLNTQAQTIAQSKVQSTLDSIENYYKDLKNNSANGKRLQALLVSVDISTGSILALVGGRNYKGSQYNRAHESHRQVGSIMKPLVYLAAMEAQDESGVNYHPLTLIDDSPFTYKYDGQSWSPKNYGKKYFGKIPLYFALKNSINVSTAKIGLQVGLSSIIDVAKRLGVTSELKPVPSLILGSFELYPLEVAQAYLTIARLGSHRPLTFVSKVLNSQGEELYRANTATKQLIAPENAATLVGMLKQTIESGTAKASRALGFKSIAAGKTGTTSDLRDNWFVGFTPETLTLVWVGYDDNSSTHLTGATGALPIWVQFMKDWDNNNQKKAPDFPWPDYTEKVTIDPNDFFPTTSENSDIDIKYDTAPVELIYRSSDTPLIEKSIQKK